jgi:Predicted metal-dependent hydrolase of the TIM-barrel fold
MAARAAEVAEHEDLHQLLTLVAPEDIDKPDIAVGSRLAAVANDTIAEIVAERPDTFPAGIGTVNLRDMDGALAELRRCVEQLGFRGVQIATTCAGEDLSEEKFLPFFEAMAGYDLPVLVHPCNGPHSKPDFIFNWPLETTWMMINLSTSSLFQPPPRPERSVTPPSRRHGPHLPQPHFHHLPARGILPERTKPDGRRNGLRQSQALLLRHRPVRRLHRRHRGRACLLRTGACLFGTDYPLDGDRGANGRGQTANTIASIERLFLSESEKAAVFSQNAVRLFRLGAACAGA